MNKRVISFCCCLFIAVAAIAAVREMDTLKTIYQNEMKRLSSEYQNERLRAPQEHTASMRELEMGYQKSGDLKGLLAVRKERLRFVRNPKVSSIQPVSIPKRLQELQQAYISRCSNMGSDYKTKTRELHTKYMSALENLQKALTQKGEIESALEVMSEIDELKNGGTPTASSGRGTARVANPLSTSPVRPSGDMLDIESLSSLLNGEVVRWNSYSREITITYDFSEESQMKDWKGGEWDTSRRLLRCNRTVAWVKLQLLKVVKVEYDVHFEGYEEFTAGFLIGDSLKADLVGGDVLNAKLFQTSEQHPLCSFSADFDRRRKYRSKIVIEKGRAEWSLNGGRVRRAILQVPIRYPTYVGFGSMTSVSGYDNISITGILSKEYETYLKQKL